MPPSCRAGRAGAIDGGIFRSEDGGDTWMQVHAGAGVWTFTATPTALFAGTDGGVLRSTNGGTTWRDFREGLFDDLFQMALARDAAGYLYAGTWGSGVFRSIEPVATSTQHTGDGTPSRVALHPNRPNPFSGETTISFDLPTTTSLRLTLYDTVGRAVAVLAEGLYPAGRHTVVWEAHHLASGVYVYRLQAGDHREARRLVPLK